MKKNGRTVSSAPELRFKASINHFKRLLLQDAHIPERAQVSAVFDELEGICTRLAPAALQMNPRFDPISWLGLRLTPRSWQSWFGDGMKMPKVQRQLMLDHVASRGLRWTSPCDDVQRQLPPRFYAELMGGGLLRALLRPTGSRKVFDVLCSRAAAYRPLSAWHLHFDALELRAHADDFGSVPWEDVVRIGAGRVMALLHELWRPGGGRIYEALSSDTRRRWNAASEEERSVIRQRSSRFGWNRHQAQMLEGACPSSQIAGVGVDVLPAHAHRLLFSIGADADFLEGDRLSAWALDLATAGLAAHALAWTDRYRLLGNRINDEWIFITAIDALLLTAPSALEKESASDCEARHLVEIERELAAAMGCSASDWTWHEMTGLKKARAAYADELRDLGLCIADVEHISRTAQRLRPLEFIG